MILKQDKEEEKILQGKSSYGSLNQRTESDFAGDIIDT